MGGTGLTGTGVGAGAGVGVAFVDGGPGSAEGVGGGDAGGVGAVVAQPAAKASRRIQTNLLTG